MTTDRGDPADAAGTAAGKQADDEAGTGDVTGGGADDGTVTDGGTAEDVPAAAACAEGVPDCFCPLSGVVDVLGRKYTLQVICVVGAHGTVRFSDLEAHLPTASTSTLSARLSDLVEEGLVTREQYDEIPPRVEYQLTAEGRELQRRLVPLLEWVSGR